MTIPPNRTGSRGIIPFIPGLNANAANLTMASDAAARVGARLLRVSFPIQTMIADMQSTFTMLAQKNIQAILVARFDGTMPDSATAIHVGTWASEFGPSGFFWQNNPTLSGQASAVRFIEFGHETSYGYQYGDAWDQPTYSQRARDYAARFVDAHFGIAVSGRPVKLLCQAEDGGSGSTNWVNGMFAQVPNLHEYVGGWVAHPYGPRTVWEPKLDRLIAHTAVFAPGSIPIDITSWGIASDNGAALDNNFGWPVNMTYDEAAAAFSSSVSEMRAKPGLGNRLRLFITQGAMDLTVPGANASRDNYVGSVSFAQTEPATFPDKGAYSSSVRTLFDPSFVPPPPPPPLVTICRNGTTMQVPEDDVLPTDQLGACAPNPPPQSPNRPVVVPSSGATPATLRVGSPTGARLQWKGVNVWGVQSPDTNNTFAMNQYNSRVTIVNTIKSWGSNCVRLRILADDYNTAPNANTGNLNKAQIIQRIVDWRNLIVGQNMYLIICTWDALDGAFSDAAWAGNAFRYHQMFSDIYAALGNDPFVVYEPTNEPNSLGGNGFDTAAWDAWQTNMQSTILHFRETIGYKGVLIIDPLWWANSGPGGQGYNDARYTAIENYDAARTGMNSTHQIVFAKHDYASNYSSLTWSPTGWQTGTGGSQIKHLIFENEFGNYNGSPSTVSDTWSSQASSFFANRFATSQNYVGGQAFLWGPWFDANAINTTDNINTTTWGNTVRQNFLLNAPSPPPPTSGFTPGVDGGSVLGLSGSLTASTSLGAKVVRQEWNMNTVPDSAMDNVIGQHASRGMRVLMLAGLPGLNPPVPASAGQLANWANRYGPGGTFWQGRSDGHLAVQHIEFGNETAFNYQTAGGNTSAAYAQKARDYATCFKVARDAIAATGKPVGLLCQGHQPDGLGPQWVDNMYAAVPNLWQYVAGWVTHPYGPDYISKLNDLINRQAAKNAPATIPIDITEIGIATDNGPAMQPHNYNWPQSMTYTQVADTLLNSAGTLTGNTIVANIRNDSRIGQRIRHFIWFQNKDQQPSGTSQREHYFGFLKSDAATSKGVLTERGRMVLRMGGGVPAGFNKVVNAGTSYSSAISGVTSGQVLGLNDGLYNWGLFTPPAGVTIKGVNQNALVVGQAAISQTGVTLSNFSLHTQSQAPGSNVAVIYVTGINFLLSRMILDANYTPNIHGMLVGGSGCKILDSIVRNTRGSAACFQTNGHNLIHAIYWFNSTNGEISRCWLYDNGGYGLHFYSGVGGSAANTVVNQVVTDQSVCNLGNVVDSITGPVTVNRSIITRAGPWNQVSPGASVVNNSRSVNGYIGAGVSGTGNVTADTTFQDRDGRDYRVPTDSNFQFFPGPA